MSSKLTVFLALIAAGIAPVLVIIIPILLIAILGANQTTYSSLGNDMGFSVIMFFSGSVIAFLHALILGLPTYLILMKYNLVRWWTSVIFGFFIGSIPMSIVTFPRNHQGDGYVSNGVAMVVDGVTTHAGWISYLVGITFFGGLGIVGGFSAWLVLKHFTYVKQKMN